MQVSHNICLLKTDTYLIIANTYFEDKLLTENIHWSLGCSLLPPPPAENPENPPPLLTVASNMNMTMNTPRLENMVAEYLNNQRKSKR